MKRLISLFILRLFGWKLEGKWPKEVKSSVICFAPHTSYLDGFIGKLFFWQLGVKHKCMMSKKYFNWITSPFLKLFGFIPVGGVKGHNAILDATGYLRESDGLNILICPEAHLRRIENWNLGFIRIAEKAKVPIVFGYLDYRNKKGGILGYTESSEWTDVKSEIYTSYEKGWAKYPEKFEFPMN